MLAADYVNAQEGSSHTNPIPSIVDELKDNFPNLKNKIDNISIKYTNRPFSQEAISDMFFWCVPSGSEVEVQLFNMAFLHTIFQNWSNKIRGDGAFVEHLSFIKL